MSVTTSGPALSSEPEILRPASKDELAQLILAAEADGQHLIVRGSGSRLSLPDPLPRSVKLLSLESFQRVLRYEPADFTVGVEAGIAIGTLEARLAANGQEIPVDLRSRLGGTIGGALAENRSGPRRGRYGTLRNFLIGVAGMRGGARFYRAGGMVVKNVAGYDVMKLLLGSRGLLGPILEANFKLRPIPAARAARLASFRSAGEAWGLARAVRERNFDPALLTVLSPAAAAALASAAGIASEAAWSLLWSHEGNAGSVAWLERETDSLLAAARVERIQSLEPPQRSAALDFLADLRTVETAEREWTLTLSLAALHSRGEEAATAISAAAGGRGSMGILLASDGSSGLHLARIAARSGRKSDGEGSRGPAEAARSLEDVLDRAIDAAKRLEGVVRIHSAPRELTARRGERFPPEGNARIFKGIRRAFDPRGVFAGLRDPDSLSPPSGRRGRP